MAGLIAIFAPDKRSRADRALEVLRTLRNTIPGELLRGADQKPDDGVQQQSAATGPTDTDPR
jgi:hypothetical protein